MVREKKTRVQDSDWECGELILGRPATAEQERKHLEKAVLACIISDGLQLSWKQ